MSTLQARSLAIVGASERARWPSEIYKNLREFGYPGRIALINPRQSEVFGERCFPSLRSLPEPVDHALVIVPAASVPGVLVDAEAAGIKSATVYASMIGDGEDPESIKRGAWLKEFVAGAGCGSPGPTAWAPIPIASGCWAIPTPSSAALAPGPVACIFQSGGLIQFWMKAAAERGLRFSYCITSGNEPDLGLADYLNFVIDDPRPARSCCSSRASAGRRLSCMRQAGRSPWASPSSPSRAARPRSRRPPRSPIPAPSPATMRPISRCASATASSTAASLDDLVETALAFDGGRLPKGPRIGFVTTSGATVDLLYDYAESEGAAMPDFSDATKAGCCR